MPFYRFEDIESNHLTIRIDSMTPEEAEQVRLNVKAN
ncbi:MAG: hypothetical protein JWN13_570 [Betaproteobacteria bacterium]|jgi:hypothetical protein|nr:hypothetical protein [Betaproteobacteria bacterium]MEA3157866.1 hypothetical protein [Betaproteobacteria bacterium]